MNNGCVFVKSVASSRRAGQPVRNAAHKSCSGRRRSSGIGSNVRKSVRSARSGLVMISSMPFRITGQEVVMLNGSPFPSASIVQNGARRQGFASPRNNRAPLTAPRRSENVLRRGKGEVRKSGPIGHFYFARKGTFLLCLDIKDRPLAQGRSVLIIYRIHAVARNAGAAVHGLNLCLSEVDRLCKLLTAVPSSTCPEN
jgi:hypothetical protein